MVPHLVPVSTKLYNVAPSKSQVVTYIFFCSEYVSCLYVITFIFIHCWGASSGIGAETAIHFAAASCDGLALIGRDKDRLEEVSIKCQTQGLAIEKVCLSINITIMVIKYLD